MAELTLPSGHVALVDTQDLPAISAHLWHLSGDAGTAYVRRRWHEGTRYRVQYMHSFLTGWPLVDHRNGNRLDNRRANLRPATLAQNAQNTAPMRGKASPYKGVSLIARRRSRPWMAQIKKDRKYHYLGYFDSQEDAARAYDSAARRLFGEYAYLNFPQEQS